MLNRNRYDIDSEIDANERIYFRGNRDRTRKGDTDTREEYNYTEITGDEDIDLNNLKTAMGYKVIIIGEDHDDEYVNWFVKQAFLKYKPQFFLTEHTQWLNIPPDKIETRLNRLGVDGLPYNRYTKRWLEMGVGHDATFIGIDYKPKDEEFDSFVHVVEEIPIKKSFTLRERRMVEVLKEYMVSSKRLLLQVGDTHLREYRDSLLGKPSPLMEYAKQHPNDIYVFRLARQYQEVP